MLDLGRSFLASVARDPTALAIVHGDVRLTYAAWFKRISAAADGLAHLGLVPGDRVVTLLQNRWENATLHWACQFLGLVITPLNWRAKADELDFCLDHAEARALIYEDVSAEAVAASARAAAIPRLAIGVEIAQMLRAAAPDASPRAAPESLSVLLYTSGTTARPKGVPRRHSAERAAALAHIAQNCYQRGERTLGIMPLYHTMGVRMLLAMSMLGGLFAALPRFDPAMALNLIARERLSALYLVPTLYHDILAQPDFAAADISSVRKLGFAGAPMPEALLQRLDAAFKPELFVNHYGSSEIYTFTVEQQARSAPGSAGRAGLNEIIRVVARGAADPNDIAAAGSEGEIIAALTSDEAFEGYWKNPEANARALRQGWYFTGDSGYFDAAGNLFVTGRIDDMIITGGENVSPVEVESCLSLHDGVDEAAVVGLADDRWGQIVTAFVKRRDARVCGEDLELHCKSSGLANFKRPRRYVFVTALPKSPVGKLLRRKLVAGEFERDGEDQGHVR